MSEVPEHIRDTIQIWKESEVPVVRLGELFDVLTQWCAQSGRGVVLIIDEVDSATNNQVFLDFLSQIRYHYIARDTEDSPAFQSVILAGVTDIMRRAKNRSWNIWISGI